MQNVPDPYRLLGVSRDASLDQIKAAHRRLAKRYHPDAPQGNRSQFLAVQEAYQLLADPLRRRQWDVRHAGGPVRADDQAGRARPRPGNGHATTRNDARRTAPPDRESRTWSARGVPWWQDAARPGPAGRRGPATRPAARSAPDGEPAGRTYARAADSNAQDPPPSRRADGGRQRGTRRTRPQSGADRPETAATSDFDVYNRSSGAAWSSAARAYFRRGVDDLPRGRAPWATHPRPRRGPVASDEAGGSGRTATEARGSDGGRPSPANTAEARAASETSEAQSGEAGGARAAGLGAAREARQGTASNRAFATGPALGTTPRFTSQGPRAGFARARRWAIEGREVWPPIFQRLVFAFAGWLPPALGLAYASASLSGCDRAAVSCPANFELFQLLAVGGLLAALLVLPKAAYLAAAGSAGLAFTAALLVIVYSVTGVAQPLPQPFAVVTLALWLAGYAFGALAAANDWPVTRPWIDTPWFRGAGGGRAANLGIARRVSRSRLGGR